MKDSLIKKGSTLFLKLIVFFIGIFTAFISLLSLSIVLKSENIEFVPIFIVMYLSVLPFLFALYQAVKLLTYIDKNMPFSNQSIRALINIKYCTIAFCVLYILISPYVYYLAQQKDAPGMMAIDCIFIFVSVVIATFAAVLQKLIQNGADIKSENDLTV